MGLAGCKADEPMVLYGMPDDMMIQEELDKASEATSESASTSTSESATLESDAESEESEGETEESKSEAVDINEDKSNDVSILDEADIDAAIEVDPEK